MILIKRLIVSFLGWLAFQAALVALGRLTVLVFNNVPTESILINLPRFARLPFVVVIAFLSGYFAYTVSLKGVVISLSLWSGLIAARPRPTLFLEWLIFCILLLLLWLPVAFFFPILYYSGSSGNLEIPIGSIWSVAVSIWLYFQTALPLTAPRVDAPLGEPGKSVAG